MRRCLAAALLILPLLAGLAPEAEAQTAGLVVSTNSLTITEGGSASFTVRLNMQPSGGSTAVVLVFPESDHEDITFTGEGNFNATVWSTAQTITVNVGEDDDIDDETGTITFNTSHIGGSGEYAGLTATIQVTIQDNDQSLTAGSITQTGATLTLGNGPGTWYSRRTAPSPAGTCTSRTGTTATLTGLTASTAYTWKAYSDNACNMELASVDFATLAPTNSAPVFSPSTATRSIAENTVAGTSVGAVIPAATDADNDSLTYSMGGTDAASFNFDTSTRQISTRSGVTYDHEAKSSYTVTVTASDGTASDVMTVTITITDVNEPPVAPAAPTVTATSGSTTGLDVSWRAPANADKPAISSYDVQYRAGNSGAFTNGPQNVSGTSTSITSLTANTAYEVRVRATNAEGDGPWSASGSGTTAQPPGTDSIIKIVDLDGNEARSFTVNEGESGNVFQISLKEQPPRNFVRVAVYRGSTSESAHTSRDFDRNNYNVPQPVRLQIEEDDDYADETLTITLRLSSGQNRNNPRFHGPQETVTVTVLDNDDPPSDLPTVTITGGSGVTEGTAASFTVRRTGARTSSLTVLLSVSENTSGGRDFVATGDEGNNKSVTIPRGSSSATYTVPTQNDSTDEPNGAVTVSLRASNDYTRGSASRASVTVSDDDGPQESVSVGGPAGGGGGGGSGGGDDDSDTSPDREALLAIYEASGGDNWDMNRNWGSNEPVSRWYGVRTDDNNRVVALYLNDNALTGEIPVSGLLSLTELAELALWGNPELTAPQGFEEQVERAVLRTLEDDNGPIGWFPEDGTYTPDYSTWDGVTVDTNGRVSELTLSGLALRGEITEAISELLRLETLDLSDNSGLYGELPPGLMDTQLMELDISGTGICVPDNEEFIMWLEEIDFTDTDSCVESEPMEPVDSEPAESSGGGGCAVVSDTHRGSGYQVALFVLGIVALCVSRRQQLRKSRGEAVCGSGAVVRENCG